MTVKIPHDNKRCQDLIRTFLFLHSESVIQNRNFKPRSSLKWKPFSAINAHLQTLMKQRTQTVSSKIIFPVNELSFFVEKLQKVGTGWQHKSSQTSFSQWCCQFNPNFSKRLCPTEKHILEGLGEKKRLHPHTRCLSDEVLTCSHTYTSPPSPPAPTKTRSTSKQSAGRKWRESVETQGPNSPLPLRCFTELLLSPTQSRRVWSGWKEAATRPAEGEQAQPAFRSCPSQIFQLQNCSQVPAHAWRISWTAFLFFFWLLWNRTLYFNTALSGQLPATGLSPALNGKHMCQAQTCSPAPVPMRLLGSHNHKGKGF